MEFLEKRKDSDADFISVAEFKSIVAFLGHYGGGEGGGLSGVVADASNEDDGGGGWAVLIDDFMQDLLEEKMRAMDVEKGETNAKK